MNCATLRMALEKLCYYQDVACAGVRTHVDLEQDLCGLRLEIMDEAIVEPSYAVNSEMTIYLTMIDAMIGTPVPVQEVRLAYARPIDTSAHVRAFRTENVIFDSSQYSLWFPASLLDSQIPHANPSLFPLFEKHLDDSLAKVQQSNSLSYRVRQEILRLLKGEEPKLIMVARALGIGERTIQMKLSEEGTGFRELLDDVRKDLAMSHLRENKLSTTDIAFLLGFSEASVFSRTFKKWTGQSPSAYRQA
jgi:AraC-like DNA-binding protein